MGDFAWCIVVDGQRVRAGDGNVSEEYNDFFATCAGEHATVLLRAEEFLRRDAAVWDAVVCFEPGYYPALLRRALARTCAALDVPVVVIVDDVHMTSLGVQFARDARARRLLGPYPSLLADAGADGDTTLFFPHSASAPYADPPPAVAPRAVGCVISGQAGPNYPERELLRDRGFPWLVQLPQPSYADGTRTHPAHIVRLLDAHTCAFVGGGAMNVLVTKHFEYAARGGVVITDPVCAHDARAFLDLEFESAAVPEDVARIVATVTPGEREQRNRRIVLSRHTTRHRASDLLQLLMTLNNAS